MTRAEYSGAEIEVAALAAIRATREASVRQKGETLECIVGTPRPARPGRHRSTATGGRDLPRRSADGARQGARRLARGSLSFVRFRPPTDRAPPPLRSSPAVPPHWLDRAIEFLIGDRLQMSDTPAGAADGLPHRPRPRDCARLPCRPARTSRRRSPSRARPPRSPAGRGRSPRPRSTSSPTSPNRRSCQPCRHLRRQPVHDLPLGKRAGLDRLSR